MALSSSLRRRRSDPLIALINIVFLMLIFFLVAATLAPPLDRDVTLARTEMLEGRAPPDAAVIRADGTMVYRGRPTTPAAYAAARAAEDPDGGLRLVPDRDLPAVALVEIGSALRAAGATDIWIVTERGLP